ncbi:MAG TPA: hypothetical protein VFE87_00340, partial [Candidatus Paceibacterota bacterium]|nr:hypothetical protein [Candidatus Paceibacterota bacterium]
MNGKRIVLIALLITSLAPVVFYARPAMAAQDDALAVLNKCEEGLQFSTVSGFIWDLAWTRLSLKGINVLTSTAEKIPWVGGAAEPIDDFVDQLVKWWNQAVYWGLLASFTNIFVGKA